MKTTIAISGQINGNFTLLRKIQIIDCDVNKTMFNGFRIEFKTKKEAKKALWEAYKELRSDFDTKNSTSYFAGWKLIYDASKAEIYDSRVM
jgi:hypothetical protein